MIARTAPAPSHDPVESPWDHVEGRLRVLVLAGISVGALVGGVGGRLAMLLLRLTSPDHVRGVTSDDGFEIGRVTLAGSYNLVALGAVIGVIGAAAYLLVRPWLLGPRWFRRTTTGIGAGVVVGSMLVHADGIDFTALEPTWLAIGLFVALPATFGVVIAVAVDAVEAHRPAPPVSLRRRLAPLLLVVPFPPTLVVLIPAGVVVAVWTVARGHVEATRRPGAWTTLVVRGAWLLVAVAGLTALVGDVRALG